MTGQQTAGFLLVDKPGGWTSHDVVAKARSALGVRKVGHAGTLDPMATGLLVLGVGRATRLLRFVQDAPKRYEATAEFGVATDTLDADGAVLSREPMRIDATDVSGILDRFTGSIMQVPPMVSARKVEGTRLYELARRGETVEREARPVVVHSLRLTDFAPSEYPEVSLEIECSKGTYVRTLADDLARALGGRAHLIALRRTAIGSLTVNDAYSIEEVAGSPEPASLLIAAADGLPDLPLVQVPDDLTNAVRNGVTIAGGNLGAPEEGPMRIVDGEGRLLAVYRAEGRKARPEVVLG